jgi:hypothetical protein
MRGKQAEKGTVIVFFALMLPFLILFAGMAIDIGRSYLHKSYMQNAADMAALAGVETVSKKKASLITVTDVPALGQLITTESSKKADAGADKFLQMDNNGKWQTGGSNVKTELRKEIDPHKNSPLLRNRALEYYYKVELTDDMEFQFAKMFLPEALMPADWTVKVEAWARGGNKDNPLAGIDLLTQMKETEEAYTFSTFQEWEANTKVPAGYNGNRRDYMKAISFTNKGPAYNADGTRSEIFDMDGTASINNNMRSLLINYKPDFSSSSKLTGNWDLDVIDNMTPAQARAYLYDLNLGIELTNWRIINENGVAIEENEGGYSLWGKFYDKLVTKFGEATATEIMFARIKSIVNVLEPYAVRDLSTLPASEISYDVYTDEPNKLDPLFIRLESEEYNTVGGRGWVTNTVRDISINIKAANTETDLDGDYKYRPMLFFYDGPVGENNERGVGRKSKTVNLTLDADFRGILFAPNSPVHVEGNGHKFQGIIIAEKFVDAAGNEIETPNHTGIDYSRLNPALAGEFQSFYARLGFSDAQYDDFRAVRLNIYSTPLKDVAYTTDRAGITI